MREVQDLVAEAHTDSPPSTAIAWPVTNDASSLARKATTAATFLRLPHPVDRREPSERSTGRLNSGLLCIGPWIGVLMTPGHTAFARTPSAAHSTAAHFISPRTPCSAAA